MFTGEKRNIVMNISFVCQSFILLVRSFARLRLFIHRCYTINLLTQTIKTWMTRFDFTIGIWVRPYEYRTHLIHLRSTVYMQSDAEHRAQTLGYMTHFEQNTLNWFKHSSCDCKWIMTCRCSVGSWNEVGMRQRWLFHPYPLFFFLCVHVAWAKVCCARQLKWAISLSFHTGSTLKWDTIEMSESGDMNTSLRNFEVNDDDRPTKISKMIHIPTLRLQLPVAQKRKKLIWMMSLLNGIFFVFFFIRTRHEHNIRRCIIFVYVVHV